MQAQDRQAAIGIVDAMFNIVRAELRDVGADSWPILSRVFKAHFANHAISITSLADASALPRTTARRLIFELKAQGLLVFRPLSVNSKRMQVEPSPMLIERIDDVTEQTIKLVLQSVDPKGVDLFDSDRSGGAGSGIAWPRTAPGSSDGSRVLHLLAFDDPVFEIIKQNRLEIERFLGMRLQISTYHQDPYRVQLERALTQPDEHGPSIVAIPAPWLATYGATHRLLDLAPLQARSALPASDFYEPIWRMCWQHGKLYGMPIQPSPHLLWYRKDLFEEAGLRPPRTFDDVLHSARVLHRPKEGVVGITWSAAPGMPLAETFLQVLIAQGEQSPEDDVLHVDSATARQVVEYLRALLPYSPPHPTQLEWKRSVQNFGSGRAAMCYHFSNRFGALDGHRIWELGGRIASVEHPTLHLAMQAVTPMGGAVLSVPALGHPEWNEAAWQAIDLLTSPQMTKYFVLNGSAGNARYSVADDRYVQQRNGIIAQTDRLMRNNRVQPFPVPVTPRYHEMIHTLSSALEEMIFGAPINIAARLSKLQRALAVKPTSRLTASRKAREHSVTSR